MNNSNFLGQFGNVSLDYNEYNQCVCINLPQVAYQPIISETTYFAVQEKLNTPCKTRQTHTQFPYNEIMLCSKCGSEHCVRFVSIEKSFKKLKFSKWTLPK